MKMLTGLLVSLLPVRCPPRFLSVFPLDFSLPHDVKRPAGDVFRIQSAKCASLLDDSALRRRVTSHDVGFFFFANRRRR
jgi:hypothetical protein